MCGRFVTVTPTASLAEEFRVDEVRAADAEPDYNVTPRAEVPIIAETADHRRVLDRVRWGLVPSWAKDLSIGDKLINARAESLVEKPAYRKAFAQRRCLILSDGFYEWKARTDAPPSGAPRVASKVKQPYFIARPDRAPFAFAGLYEVWKDRSDPDAEWMRSCAIITTEANDALREIHERMPVVLDPSEYDSWLASDQHDTGTLQQLLDPAPDDFFTFYAVSTLVNKPVNNSPELLEPVPVDTLL
jgi:putative SOS response-associated peptidase YedK